VLISNRNDGFSTEEWAAGLSAVLSPIRSVSSPVVIADTPEFSFDPASCASANLEDLSPCTLSDDVAIAANFVEIEEATVESEGGSFLDLNDYLCTDEACGPVIGATLAFRDEHHITAELSEELGDTLGAELRAVGVLG